MGVGVWGVRLLPRIMMVDGVRVGGGVAADGPAVVLEWRRRRRRSRSRCRSRSMSGSRSRSRCMSMSRRRSGAVAV